MQLIIAEKPKVAQKIASFLGKKVVRKSMGTVSYYEIDVDGKKVVVAPAVGHIFGLSEKNKNKTYPTFDIEWLPAYKINKKAYYTKAYVDLLTLLSKNADELIVATDYDIEGSLIGYNVFRFCYGKENGKRMHFSAITLHDIKEAYAKIQELDYSNAYAGEARHMLDWYYGINLSRALMTALRKANAFKIMSIGRVQGPTLALLAKKEIEIKNFVPVPYWELFLYAKNCEFKHINDRFLDKKTAEKIFERIGKQGEIENIEKQEKTIFPYPPFDLTELQLEAYRLFGFSPSKTLQLAQSLYENSFISYPRTSSQKLPPNLGLKKIINKIAEIEKYKETADELIKNNWFKPFQGKKQDPAHPAIHPTGIYGKMGEQEKKLYDLVVKRFLAVFAPFGKKELTRVFLNTNKEIFVADGARITEPGWTKIYGDYYTTKEKLIPEFSKQEIVDIEDKRIEEKETKPPKRYSQASLISELESKHLGTKTTRATIVDTLFDRDYIKGKAIETTSFGLAVYNTLKKNAPRILDEELTRKMEEKMEKIQTKKMEKETLLKEGKKTLLEILNEFKTKESEIGQELKAALDETELKEKVVGKCNKCKGNLKIINFKGSNFIGCTNYPDCRTSFPLPKFALIKPTGKVCKEDNMPIVLVFREKKRFEMCIAPGCLSKAHWGKNTEKSKAKKSEKPKNVSPRVSPRGVNPP